MSKPFQKMSHAELRESRAPKFDVMFKMVFSLEGSSLRRLLSIPKGIALSEKFPDLDDLEIDSLTLSGNQLYHLEFQAQNHPLMLRRMYEYRAKIIDRDDIKDFIASDSPQLEQQVLYVGSDPMNMRNEWQQDGEVVFSYTLRNIRRFVNERKRLASSKFPEDWVLSLLVAGKNEHDDEEWRSVATKMRCELDPTSARTAEFRTILLIASVLREIAFEVQEEIAEMIELDVSKNRLLLQVFEQGMQAAYPVYELDRIEKYILRNKVEVDLRYLDEIRGWPAEDIASFAEEFDDADNKQEFFDRKQLRP